MAEHENRLDVELPELCDDDACLLDASPSGEVGPSSPRSEQALVTPLAAEVIPPERVRFTAPVELRVEDDDERYVGAVLNLSQNGVACTVPCELTAGQRVWIRFRLGLADEAVSLLCVVIWRREVGHHDPIYGLQFGSLADEERDHIVQVVAERADGRAGEWPLPLMPTQTAPENVRAQPSTWVSAAAGMVAGIALALVLSAIPHFGVASAPSEAAAVDEPELALAADEPELAVAAPAPVAVAEQPAPPAAELAPAVAAAPAAPAPSPQAAAPAAERPTPVAAEKVAPTPAPVATSPVKLEVLRPVAKGKLVELALVTDGAVSAHKGFWLESPRRYVIDVEGRKNGFASNTLEVKHALVTKVRVGDHAGRVRFVLDVSPSAKDEVRTRAEGNAVVVELRAK